MKDFHDRKLSETVKDRIAIFDAVLESIGEEPLLEQPDLVVDNTTSSSNYVSFAFDSSKKLALTVTFHIEKK